MEEIPRIDQLIVRKLTGTLTPEESAELRGLITSDADREYVDTYERLWNESRDSMFHKIDAAEDWAKVRTRMGFNKGKVVPMRKMLLRVAAVVVPALILLTVITAYYFVPGFGRLTAYNAAEKEQILLPDGSDVTLKKGSKLIIVRNLKGDKRTVKLTGEAYFEVAKDRMHPFEISIADVKVEVLGTAFNLENTGDEVRINVTRGVVRFSHKNEELLVHKGEEAVFNGKSISKNDIKDNNYIAWKTGVMNFNDDGLEDILEVIKDTYDEVTGYKLNTNSKVKVTTGFDNQPLSSVLDELQIHFNKKIVLHDGILIISD